MCTLMDRYSYFHRLLPLILTGIQDEVIVGHAVLCHILLGHVVLCYILHGHVVPCYILHSHVVLCYIFYTVMLF